jgi:hypothetical protein
MGKNHKNIQYNDFVIRLSFICRDVVLHFLLRKDYGRRSAYALCFSGVMGR